GRKVGGGARPQRTLVRTRDRDEQGPQGVERLDLGKQAERLLDPDRRKRRLGHRPYSFIFRVNVLRWIPSSSAAAPICPLVCASTPPVWRASPSATATNAP